MVFVKSNELKVGMRLAKPIYNRNGVLLYERDTKLTDQGIKSVNNFGLIGIYVLEPAEPVPPMTTDDVEFERFQTMGLFTLKDELGLVLDGKGEKNIFSLANSIIKKYGFRDKKINFIQNLRSKDDYVYKHSLNVAILSAVIANKLKLSQKDKTDVVLASLYHDIGKLMLPSAILKKPGSLNEMEMGRVRKAELDGVNVVGKNDKNLHGAKSIMLKTYKDKGNPDYVISELDSEKFIGALILKVANDFDEFTSMSLESGPSSEIEAIKYMLNQNEKYNEEIVNALLDGVNILTPGVCIELTDGQKGIVLVENHKDVLKPVILYFRNNTILNLNHDDVSQSIGIKDIMKTMDNRYIFDKEILEKYKKENGIIKDNV